MSAASQTAEPCEYLDWDSGFFGRRIARVQTSRLDEASADAVMKWCASHRIDCLYFLADPDDPHTVRLAEDQAFRFVDIRVTMAWRAGQAGTRAPCPGAGLKVRPSGTHDIATLTAIARTSYRSARFYFDQNFTEARADALYEEWTAKSCRGYADVVLVADVDGVPKGYISCHVHKDGSGQIGLIGVCQDSRGQGIGQALVQESLSWFKGRGVASVRVVTQGRNRVAQRLYERGGFLIDTVALWYHRWFLERPDSC